MNERDMIKNTAIAINVEQGTFTPIVFTSEGEIARQSQIYKRMAELMIEKGGGRGGREKDSSLHG